jgi:hypothetical protein
MFELERTYNKNYCYNNLLELAKNGTLLPYLNSKNKFIKSKDNKFYYLFSLDSSFYDVEIPFKFNLYIRQKILKEKENSIDLLFTYKTEDNIVINQFLYANSQNFTIKFKYDLDNDKFFHKIVIDIIILSFLNWIENLDLLSIK